ncbi:MAG: hemerythrin domain-containing protein [Methanomicrobiales archaeon]|nr:hemerythrin domain-containing protein [Methanomicrobiales archaeon]
MPENIIDTLKQEHEMVLSILSELISKGISGREQKYATLKENLMPHLIGEEQILYPKLKEDADMRDISFEAVEEHSAVKTLLGQLDSVSTSDEEIWVAKIKVIQENVSHHISEEEEKIFVQMQRKMSSDELSSLDSQYKEAKKSVIPVAAQ